MTRSQREQAEALDAYLTELQSGNQPAGTPPGLADEATLLDRLAALSRASTPSGAGEPDPAFVKALGTRLETASRQQVNASSAVSPRPGEHPRLMGWLADRLTRLDQQTVRVLAGAAAVIVVGVVLLWWLRPDEPQQAQAIPTLVSPTPASLALAPTAAPTSTPPAAPPTTAPRVATAVAPDTTPQSEEAVPTPTVPPSPTASGPIVLPSLAALAAGGLGGGGAEVSRPTDITFVLSTTLPAGPAQATIYTLRQPEPLSSETALQTAGRWGFDARLYTPQPLTGDQSLGDAVYVAAIDDPYQIVFEDARSFSYTDRSRSPLHIHCWQTGDELPAEEQAIGTAESYLEDAGLLPTPYAVSASGNSVRVFRLLEGQWRLLTPSADVSICRDGQVGGVTVRQPLLDRVGEVPVLSAKAAWDMLNSGQPAERVWVGFRPLPAGWGVGSPEAPRAWSREYQDGQRADLFRGLEVLYPVDPDDDLRVTMGSLRLSGDLPPLVAARDAAVATTGDVEAPIHVWGLLQEANGLQTLVVQGWQPAPLAIWSGTVQREAGVGRLVTLDGEVLSLPDLPADLPDGADVFVHGGRIADRLEWHIIQLLVTGQEPPLAAAPAPAEVVVNHVELVYLVPSLEIMSQDPASALPGWCAAQPVWLFQGRWGDRMGFTAYVQAAEPAIVEANTAD